MPLCQMKHITIQASFAIAPIISTRTIATSYCFSTITQPFKLLYRSMHTRKAMHERELNPLQPCSDVTNSHETHIIPSITCNYPNHKQFSLHAIPQQQQQQNLSNWSIVTIKACSKTYAQTKVERPPQVRHTTTNISCNCIQPY